MSARKSSDEGRVQGDDSDAAFHHAMLSSPTQADHDAMVAPHVDRLVALGWPREQAAAIYPYDPTAPLSRTEREGDDV
jgi:hypothetical protein